MHLELLTEGRYSQRTKDIENLRESQIEHGTTAKLPSGHAVTILKILTLIAGVFFSSAAIICLQPQVAFISVTLILIASGTIATGSEKIITIFPERIWTSSPSNRITLSGKVVEKSAEDQLPRA